MRFLISSAALLGLSSTALAAPLPKRDVQGPVIQTDFPDPSILKVDNTWYAFGTQSLFDYKDIKVQFATSNDFTSWSLRENYDALRNLPSWVDASNPKVWAPDIFQLDDGSFVMYFSATTKTAGNGAFHCIGAAKSSSVDGPYDSVSDTPLACDTDRGGSIDASAFRDADGKRYMLYKIDGNAVGNGGYCNNANNPQQSTPIMLQQVGDDGVTIVGQPTQILDRGPADGPLIEAPSLVRAAGGKYVLHFSSQCYTDSHYSSSYAVSDNLTDGYEKAQFPLLVTGTPSSVWGPGGADVDWDTQHMAFHAYSSADAVGGRRSMFVGRASFNSDTEIWSLNI